MPLIVRKCERALVLSAKISRLLSCKAWFGVDGCEAIWTDEYHVDVVIFMNRERALNWEKFLSIKDDIGVLS